MRGRLSILGNVGPYTEFNVATRFSNQTESVCSPPPISDFEATPGDLWVGERQASSAPRVAASLLPYRLLRLAPETYLPACQPGNTKANSHDDRIHPEPALSCLPGLWIRVNLDYTPI